MHKYEVEHVTKAINSLDEKIWPAEMHRLLLAYRDEIRNPLTPGEAIAATLKNPTEMKRIFEIYKRGVYNSEYEFETVARSLLAE